MRATDGARRWALVGVIGLAAAGCADRREAETVAAASAPPAGRAEIAASTSAAGRSSGPVGCAEALAALSRAGSQPVHAATPQPLALVLLEEPGREVTSLRLDLPLPLVREPGDAEAPCLLMIEAAAGTAERRVVGRERIWSERVGSVDRRPNPEYETARRELARLADRLDREDREQARDLKRLTPTGNAWVDALGLVGGLVLGGIGSLSRDREFEEARARLEAVPRWIDETRFEPYQVTVMDTELVRRATVRLALIEPEGGRFWATSLPIARVDRLRVAADLHPRDRNRLGGEARLLGPTDLEALASVRPPLVLSELLPRLARLVAEEPARPGGPLEARLAWTGEAGKAVAASGPASVGASAGELAPGPAPATASATPLASPRRSPLSTNSAAFVGAGAASSGAQHGDPLTRSAVTMSAARSDPHGPPASEVSPGAHARPPDPIAESKLPAEIAGALVRVDGPGGRAHGFYVASDKILTLARAVAGSSLARIETADGFLTWGVVAREQPDSELLLVHVPRPGRHLAVAHPAAATPPGPLPAPGLPLLRDGRVVGVSLDPLEGRFAGTAELARILAEPAGR